MRPPLIIDGKPLQPISVATYEFVRAHLPRVPAEPGIIWIVGTCWTAGYTHHAMKPQHFAGWECLNEVV